ncbi:bis(5'-nucleosyl)-tetraphosphatase PrpE [Virgibacillus kimchii]
MKIDIIGDVHGCLEELHDLFHKLNYRRTSSGYEHEEERMPVFLGDITDRGPASIEVIRLVYEMVTIHKNAYYVPGNHCDKLYRFFKGNPVKLNNGLETTAAEYEALNTDEKNTLRNHFIQLYEEAPLYLEIPEAGAIIAHAGIKESLIGRTDKKVKTFVLYGDITGEKHPDGRPVRRDWAQYYKGNQWIVYGHTPVKNPRVVNKTINIDTGCVFGNALTAFRLPEEETVSVPSKQPFTEEKFRPIP